MPPRVDDQLDPTQAAPRQLSQEPGPDRLGLGDSDLQVRNLVPPIGIKANCDDHGDRDDPPVAPGIGVGGVDSQD